MVHQCFVLLKIQDEKLILFIWNQTFHGLPCEENQLLFCPGIKRILQACDISGFLFWVQDFLKIVLSLQIFLKEVKQTPKAQRNSPRDIASYHYNVYSSIVKLLFCLIFVGCSLTSPAFFGTSTFVYWLSSVFPFFSWWWYIHVVHVKINVAWVKLN